MPAETEHIGTLLLEEGLLTQRDLERAAAVQAESGLPLTRVLVEEHMVAEGDIVRLLARHSGLEYVNLAEITIDPAAAALVPEALARRYGVIPIGFDNERLVVAMTDPGNVLVVDDLRAITGMRISPRIATRTDILDAIRRLARYDDSVADLADMVAESETEDLSKIEAAVEEAPVVKLINTLITRAVNERASDLHLEPGETDLRVRFRIDGVLHEVMSTPRAVAGAVVSRVKIMADLDIAERRVPQDGRVGLRVNGRAIDLRVATLPSIYGEKVVIRVLDKDDAVLQLSDLGFMPHALDRFSRSLAKPYGAILVTGPTGSGKTTTLYAALNVLNKPDRNIITVEDPVEYRLAGVTQVQVNRKAGLLFATALKSILRSDPDIVLVGEVRDPETAKTAVEAALTGPPGAHHPPHQRCRFLDQPPGRHGRRGLPGELVSGLHRGPAARSQALPALPPPPRGHPGGAGPGGSARRGGAGHHLRGGRLQGVLRDRVPRAAVHQRGADGYRGDPAHGGGAAPFG